MTELDVLALSAPIGIFRSTPEHGNVWVNHRYLELTGLAHDEALGDAWLSIVHPDDLADVELALSSVHAEPRDTTIEFRVVARDGTSRRVRARLTPYAASGGAPAGFVGAIEDVTRQVEAEAELRASEQRFRSLAAAAPIGVAYAEATGRIVYVNEHAALILGRPAAELLGELDVEVAHPDDAEIFAAATRRVTEGEDWQGELRIRRPDGGIRNARVGLGRVLDPDGELVGYVGTIEDVTEETRDRARLERLTAVLASTPDHAAITDRAGRFLYLNPAGRRWFGVAPEADVVGIPGSAIVRYTDESWARLTREAAAALADDGVHTAEVTFALPDGRELPVLQATVAHRQADGEIEYYSMVARDISALKEAERRLARSEAWFRSLVQHGSDLVTVHDHEFRTTYAGPAVEAMLGHLPEDLIGRVGDELLHPDDRENAIAAFVAALEGPQPSAPIEYRSRHRDGTWRVLESRVTNLLDDPVVRGIVINSRDVTERRVAEEARTRSEQSLRARAAADSLVADVSRALVAAGTDDADARVVESLARIAAHVGADAAVLRVRVGEGLATDVHEWHAPDMPPAPLPGELAVSRPDGAERETFLRRTSAVIAPGSGEVRAVGGFDLMGPDRPIGSFTLVWRARDPQVSRSDLEPMRALGPALVSTLDRARAEQAVRASEERYRSLAEHSSDYVVVYGPDGVIRYLSPPTARLTGFSVGTHLGAQQPLAHPDDSSRTEAVFAQVASMPTGSSSEPFEVRIRRVDGAYRWMELVATNLLDDPVVGGIVINGRDVTERRQATDALGALNESLRRSNSALTAIVQSSPLAIYAVDAVGVVGLWNPACEQIFGWSAHEACGNPARVVLERDREECEDIRARVMEGEMIAALEVRRATKSGREIDVSFAAAPLRDEAGDVTGMLVVSSDISERVEAERQLRGSELRFRAIVQNVAEGITVLNDNGTVRYASPAAQRMLGYAEGDGYGSDPLAFVHPDDHERVAEVIARAFAEPGVHGPVALRVQASDGSWRHLEAIGNNLLEEPTVRGVVVTARDVTERVTTEEALRRSDERFRALVQNLSDVITVVGPGGKLAYTSPAANRLFGFEDGDDTWTDPTTHVHPDDLERVVAEFSRQIQGTAGGPVAFRLLTADGSYRHVEAVAQDLTDDPAVGGIVVTTRDVSERTRAEAMVADQARVLRLIAQGAPLSETLATMCRVVEAQIPDALCSILLVDPNEQVLRAGAGPSLPAEISQAAAVVPIGPDQGACGTAAYRGEQVVVEDIATDPKWAAWRDLTLEHGLRACFSTPIQASSGDRVIGTFAVYFRDARRPTPEHEEVVEMITQLAAIAIERRAFEDRLAHQAHHDHLTGLPNRSLFVEFLTLALARARRQRSAVAVLFLDLDRFKNVNDSLGHDAGDALLVKVAARLRGVIRPGDTVARFGGDEFTVLCDDLPEGEARHHAVEVARRLLEVIEEPIELDGKPAHLSTSIGIAIARPGDRPESLLRDADAAMYRAKELGKARWEVFDEEMRSSARTRLETENALHRALERDELSVFFQPVVELGEGRCVGAEALLRWQHPERGLVLPGGFIDLAEETGLIVPIGAWVLEEACRTVAGWCAQGGVPSSFTVSVNLSARQLAHADLVHQVERALAQTGARPEMICLEITESVLMGEASMDTVEALKALGVGLSIDDFGTGYSSLGYLKRFPVDLVKVDRSFVDGLGTDPEDSAIVAAVVSLGHALGLRVVAEGVETDRQLAELVRLGCDQAQGFWFSPARPVADFVPLLRPGQPWGALPTASY